MTARVTARVTIREAPYNAETAPAALAPAITPAEAHYVRSNFDVPSIAPAAYALALDGAVTSSRRVTLAELATLPWHEHVVTVECAGNDRLGLRPLPAGEPWASGAVATARWGGVRLADVLALVDVHPEAIEVVATGADAGPRDDAAPADHDGDARDGAPGAGPSRRAVRFARSLPLDVARHPDTLLALHMNGAPLQPAHGAPVRLVVPGWYGMANVKWLQALTLVTAPFTGYFQQRRYVYDTADGVTPVTRMRVKSLITSPAAGEVVAPGPLTVQGWAWSGNGPITRVEVNVDGGDAWHDATLGPPDGAHAWTPFTCVLGPAQAGRLVLASRASDASGAVQPAQVTWNRLGYGNNAVRPVVVEVRASPEARAPG